MILINLLRNVILFQNEQGWKKTKENWKDNNNEYSKFLEKRRITICLKTSLWSDYLPEIGIIILEIINQDLSIAPVYNNGWNFYKTSFSCKNYDKMYNVWQNICLCEN